MYQVSFINLENTVYLVSIIHVSTIDLSWFSVSSYRISTSIYQLSIVSNIDIDFSIIDTLTGFHEGRVEVAKVAWFCALLLLYLAMAMA